MGGWLRHRLGGVGLRSERPGITGAMGPSTSWDQWPHPVTRAVVGTQECTQIGENGLSAPDWGVCVHCCAVGLGCGWPWDRNSVHKWEDRASPRRFGAFVYTVAPREDRANDRSNAGVYTDWLKRPLGAVLGHLCTLLRREGHASRVVACDRYAIVPVASLGECRLLDDERVAAGVARQKRRDRAEQRILDR